MQSAPQPIVVLISGRGSNLRALVSHTAPPGPYRVAEVLSNRADAAGLTIAREAGISSRILVAETPITGTPGDPVEPTGRRAAYDRRLAAAIDESAPALIVLAGFMRILSPEFVARYPGRILNIHPSLLPKYPGLDTHRRVLEAGDREHGATVHFVSAELDAGAPVIQARVAVHPTDDEHTLAKRVLAAEHAIYPQAVRWFCEGRLQCRDGRAWLDGAELREPVPYVGPHGGRAA